MTAIEATESQVDEFGRYVVTRARQTGITNREIYCISDQHESDGQTVEVGTGKNGKQQARTLAAALDKADTYGTEMIPPELRIDEYAGDEWEEWAGKNEVIPARIAAAGPAPMAAWLKVVHREREKWIGDRLGVKEATVRQYLSDLREGRR